MAQAVESPDTILGGIDRLPTQAALARRVIDLLNSATLMLLENNTPSLPQGDCRRIPLSFSSDPLPVPECGLVLPAEGSPTTPLLASAEITAALSPRTKPAVRAAVLEGYSHSRDYSRGRQAANPITEHSQWRVHMVVGGTRRNPRVDVGGCLVPMADRWEEYYTIFPDDPDCEEKTAIYHRASWQYEIVDQGVDALPLMPPIAEGRVQLQLSGARRCTPEDVKQVGTYLAVFGRAVTAHIDA